MMQTFTLDFFIVLFDLLGITVCGFTILYLIRMNLQRKAYGQTSGEAGERDAPRGGLLRPREKFRHLDPYQEVRQMAKMNMSPRDISERVKIPRGEVELIVKFSRLALPAEARRA